MRKQFIYFKKRHRSKYDIGKWIDIVYVLIYSIVNEQVDIKIFIYIRIYFIYRIVYLSMYLFLDKNNSYILY